MFRQFYSESCERVVILLCVYLMLAGQLELFKRFASVGLGT